MIFMEFHWVSIPFNDLQRSLGGVCWCEGPWGGVALQRYFGAGGRLSKGPWTGGWEGKGGTGELS